MIDVGSVMFHPVGTNPYVYAKQTYRGETKAPDRREMLAHFQAGILPAGWAAWDDRNHVPLTDPKLVSW